MIPAFNETGLLPPGIHPADRNEFQKRFAIFNQSDRRVRIGERLNDFLEAALRSAIVKRIVVAGSYVTSKAEPNDFDCILVLDRTIVGTTLRPFEYNLVSRRMARRIFGGDVMSALEDSEALNQYLEFFQTTREGERMGIVEIAS